MIFPGFVGPSAPGFSTSTASDRCINWFAELIETQPNGKNRYALLPSPGVTDFATLTGGSGAVTSLYYDSPSGRLFAVSATKLLEIASNGTVTDRGTVSSAGTNPTFITSNGTQLFIASNSNGYTFTLATNTLSSAIAGVTPSDADFIDGYFVATSPATQKFYISGLYDGSTWDALDFASVEALPDNLTRILCSSRLMWALGQESIQIYRNTGAVDFPFEPTGTVIEQGCIAKGSAAKLDNSIFWLGGDGRGAPVVFRTEGESAVRISTHAMEHALTNTSWSHSDAVGMTYVDRGHAFYQILFPTANQTWRYDVSTGLWHEVARYASSAFEAHCSRVHAYAFNKHIVGARDTNKLYEMSETLENDTDGSGVRRERTCPHLTNENKRVFYGEFQLDMSLTGSGTISLAWSNDGGSNFGSYISRSIGGAGTRVRWTAGGSGRDRVYRVMSTAKVVLNNAYLELNPGMH